MATKVIQYGVNRPLPISLDEEYMQALDEICHKKGLEPANFCKNWIEFGIRHYCHRVGVKEPPYKGPESAKYEALKGT